MIYRSADEEQRRRRDELCRRRQLEVAVLPEAIPAVYVRRRARLAAGAAGVGCAVFLALCTALRREGLTTILQASWVLMAGIYVFARVTAGSTVQRALARAFTPTEDPLADLSRLEDLTPTTVVRELADRIEQRSVGLPMMALALFLPLSLHYLAVSAVRFGTPEAQDFDSWISLSLLFVGHCHIVLCYQIARYAGRLRGAEDVFSVGLISDRSGWHAWGMTIVSSIAAGTLLLLFIPIAGIALVIVAPAIVAATGLLFIPLMFARMGKKVREERLLLTCEQTPPRIVEPLL